MERLMKKKTIQKIVLVIVAVLSLNIIAYPVNAADEVRIDETGDGGLGGVLATPICSLLNLIGDAVNFLFEMMLIGDDASWPIINGDEATGYMDGTAEYNKKAPADANDLPEVRITRSKIKSFGLFDYDVAVIKLTPAEIFAGKVASLDANFFADDNYAGKLGYNEDTGESNSIVAILKDTISGWYIAIRNIAIVGLLSVLVYLGIRMVISSSVGDKAKYKQMFLDWVIALCLIFFLHYIMSFAMTLSEAVTSMLAGRSSADGTIDQVIIQLTEDNNDPIPDRRFYSNFVNVVRIKSQLPNFATKFGYVFLYLVLTAYTAYFSVIYIKRLLMLAFLTMIAPFVALTYPLDKLKDGHAQAFNFWVKEYIFYAMLQPLHMLLYTVFVSSAISVAANNMIYAIVAIAFIMPAEKIVKQMFGIHGNTEGNIAGFAGGAVAGSLMSKLNKPPRSPKTKGGQGGGEQSKLHMAKNPSGANINDALGAGSVPLATQVAMQQDAQRDQQTSTSMAQGAQGYQQTDTSMAQGAQGDQQADTSMAGAVGSAYSEGTATNPESGGPSSEAARNAVETSTPNSFGNNLNSSQSSSQNTEKRSLKNNLGRAIRRRYRLAGGGKGLAKALGKGALKVGGAYAKAGGIIGGAMIGGAIGMMGDGPAGMFKGMGIGAAAGPGIVNRGIGTARNIGNSIGNTISGKNGLGSFLSEVKYGSVEESLRKRGESEYVNNRDNLARIQEEHGDTMNAKQLREYARREYNMMYDSKTDDVDKAGKALKLEDKYRQIMGNDEEAHKRAAGVLNASKAYDKSTFLSQKKLWEAEDVVTNNLQAQGMSKEEAIARTDRTFQDIADLHGVKVNVAALRQERERQQQRGNANRNSTNPQPIPGPQNREQRRQQQTEQRRQSRQSRQSTQKPDTKPKGNRGKGKK